MTHQLKVASRGLSAIAELLVINNTQNKVEVREPKMIQLAWKMHSVKYDTSLAITVGQWSEYPDKFEI